MFKALIGRGHPEFSTMRQQVYTAWLCNSLAPTFSHTPQDAQEFFLHLLSAIDKNERTTTLAGASNPVDSFRFQFEDKVECVVSGKVRYSKRDDYLLQLPVPMEMALNKSKINHVSN